MIQPRSSAKARVKNKETSAQGGAGGLIYVDQERGLTTCRKDQNIMDLDHAIDLAGEFTGAFLGERAIDKPGELHHTPERGDVYLGGLHVGIPREGCFNLGRNRFVVRILTRAFTAR